MLFVVFGNPQKTNVVDVLFWNAASIHPLVDGIYNQNLRAVKVGDSVEHVRSLLGNRQCDYLRGEDGNGG